MTADEPIPDTTSTWATREGNGDIPRSDRNSVYKPPLRLSDFLSFVRDNNNLKPHAKALIYEVAEDFKQVKQERGR